MLRGLDLSANFSFGTLGSHKALSMPLPDVSESSSLSSSPNGSSSSLTTMNGLGSSLDLNQKFSLKGNHGSSLEKVKVHNLLNDELPKKDLPNDTTEDSSAASTLLAMASFASQAHTTKSPHPQHESPRQFKEVLTLPPLSSFDLPMPFSTVQPAPPAQPLPAVPSSVASILPPAIHANIVNSTPLVIPSVRVTTTNFPSNEATLAYIAMNGGQKQWWQANASQLRNLHEEQVLKPATPQFKQQKPPSKSNRGIFDNHWKQHFNELREFKKLNGHTNVTRTTDQWRNLGNWVAEQRRKMRKGKLTRVQFQLLQSIGFEWDRSYYFKPNSGASFEGLTAEELREIEEITGNNPL